MPKAFVRLRGRSDRVIEHLALVSPGSEYSLIPKVDAYALGYPEAARDNMIIEPPNLVRGVTYNGYWEGMLIRMKEVEVGARKVQDVEFVAFDVPQAAAFDVVLGKALLSSLGVVVDYSDMTWSVVGQKKTNQAGATAQGSGAATTTMNAAVQGAPRASPR